MNLQLHKPTNAIQGTIKLPGSKSISNRVLMIKALSGLNFSINNLSDSDDTNHLLHAFESIQGNTSNVIDIGHAGTDMRFLTAYLSSRSGNVELTGSERMQQRPIKELVDVLQLLGADITYKNNEGYPPLLIKGKKIAGGKTVINGNVSSQFISALLLVAPYFEKGLELTIEKNVVSKPYINMTIDMMKEFGASVDWNQNIITVKPVPYSYSKPEYTVESDWSAASYFFSLIALSKLNTELKLNGLFQKSLQADSVCADIYKSFGVETEYLDNKIKLSKTKLLIDDKLNYDFIDCPDIAQTVVCTSLALKTSFNFTGLQTLKVKETDRILALKNEVNKFGFDIDVTLSSISYNYLEPQTSNNTFYIATYNDHRMAMAFAPLCLVFENIVIEDAEVVSKSYPEFWNDLKRIGIFYKSV